MATTPNTQTPFEGWLLDPRTARALGRMLVEAANRAEGNLQDGPLGELVALQPGTEDAADSIFVSIMVDALPTVYGMVDADLI